MGHNEKIINLEFILPDIIHFFILHVYLQSCLRI